jgi:hypothetical protein
MMEARSAAANTKRTFLLSDDIPPPPRKWVGSPKIKLRPVTTATPFTGVELRIVDVRHGSDQRSVEHHEGAYDDDKPPPGGDVDGEYETPERHQ